MAVALSSCAQCSPPAAAEQLSPASPSSPNRALLLNCIHNKLLFQDIIQELTGDPDCCQTSSYCWTVHNKYYSANIILDSFSLHGSTNIFKIKPKHYEAVVIFLDCTQTDTQLLGDLRSRWSDVSRQLTRRGIQEEQKHGLPEEQGQPDEQGQELPDVCLLLAVVGEEKEQVKEVLQWSVEEGFELIEWSIAAPSHSNSHSQSHGEEEEQCEGGTARLAEALQAHMWPEMTMRSRTSCDQPSSLSDLKKGIPSPLPALTPPSSAADSTVPEEHYSSAEEKLLAEGLDPAQDPGGETFEQLFARFADMKEHADNLSHEERKDYAEKVVMAFWAAIGGDDEEVKEPPMTS